MSRDPVKKALQTLPELSEGCVDLSGAELQERRDGDGDGKQEIVDMDEEEEEHEEEEDEEEKEKKDRHLVEDAVRRSREESDNKEDRGDDGNRSDGEGEGEGHQEKRMEQYQDQMEQQQKMEQNLETEEHQEQVESQQEQVKQQQEHSKHHQEQMEQQTKQREQKKKQIEHGQEQVKQQQEQLEQKKKQKEQKKEQIEQQHEKVEKQQEQIEHHQGMVEQHQIQLELHQEQIEQQEQRKQQHKQLEQQQRQMEQRNESKQEQREEQENEIGEEGNEGKGEGKTQQEGEERKQWMYGRHKWRLKMHKIRAGNKGMGHGNEKELENGTCTKSQEDREKRERRWEEKKCEEKRQVDNLIKAMSETREKIEAHQAEKKVRDQRQKETCRQGQIGGTKSRQPQDGEWEEGEREKERRAERERRREKERRLKERMVKAMREEQEKLKLWQEKRQQRGLTGMQGKHSWRLKMTKSTKMRAEHGGMEEKEEEEEEAMVVVYGGDAGRRGDVREITRQSENAVESVASGERQLVRTQVLVEEPEEETREGGLEEGEGGRRAGERGQDVGEGGLEEREGGWEEGEGGWEEREGGREEREGGWEVGEREGKGEGGSGSGTAAMLYVTSVSKARNSLSAIVEQADRKPGDSCSLQMENGDVIVVEAQEGSDRENKEDRALIEEQTRNKEAEEEDGGKDERNAGEDGEGGDREPWENMAFSICQQRIGQEKFQKLTNKPDKLHTSGSGFCSKLRLSYLTSQLKRIVTSPSTSMQHYNAVGAVGYAVASPDEGVPEARFFERGNRFRLRLRHCAVQCDDDAASCVRQVALKFCDQNEDGPLDLLLFTGRVALARNIKTLKSILLARSRDQIRGLCSKDPQYYFSLVDALRRSPSCYTCLHYYSQMPYLFTARDGKHHMVKLRLVPFDNDNKETGLLKHQFQHAPWNSSRCKTNSLPVDYLRHGFSTRLQEGPIRYRLQIQVRQVKDASVNDCDAELWNPQNLWDVSAYPWLNLMELIFTTLLPQTTTNRTAFNVVNRPKCLNFLRPDSIWDYRSYNSAFSTVCTAMEVKGIKQSDLDLLPTSAEKRIEKVSYIVALRTGQPTQGISNVDVFLTLTGASARTAPARLDKCLNGSDDHADGVRHFRIRVDDVGDVLAVTVGVRHRQLAANWLLRYVSLTDVMTGDVKFFPFHDGIVFSKVTLRPSAVCLPHLEVHEVLRQERALEIRDRQHECTWRKLKNLPSRIRASASGDLPSEHRLLPDKYTHFPGDSESTSGGAGDNWGSSAVEYFHRARSGSYRHVLESDVTGLPQSHSTLTFVGALTPRSRMVQRRASTTSAYSSVPHRMWSNTKQPLSLKDRLTINIPEGIKGDMCRAWVDDRDLGRLFTQGPNPVTLQRISEIPDKIAITDDLMLPMLEPGRSLRQELQAGRVFLVDYSLLDGVPLNNQDGRCQHSAAPVVLLRVNLAGDLVPIAIQLHQTPADDNPVWLPTDSEEGWLLAKLWVRFADFTNQLGTHMFYCHLVVEPFVVATSRQLSASHPMYKLLKPHFRYLLAGNALLRMHVLNKGGALDGWTSVGSEGNRTMMERLYKNFHMDQLDFMADLRKRGFDNNNTTTKTTTNNNTIHNNNRLPTYYYRDDGIRLWNAINRYCRRTIERAYRTDADVVRDCEIQAWLADVTQNGFAVSAEKADDIGLPVRLRAVTQLVSVVCRVLFVVTWWHGAQGNYGPAPAAMRQPAPSNKGAVTLETVLKTLPDREPERYNTVMANVTSLKSVAMTPLLQRSETCFVESEAGEILEDFRKELTFVTKVISERNANVEYPYEALNPGNIFNRVQLLPLISGLQEEPEAEVDEAAAGRAGAGAGADAGADYACLGRAGWDRRVGREAAASVPLLAAPICVTFARSVGGKSTLGRCVSVNVISQAMSGVGLQRVRVPMHAFDRHQPFGMGIDSMVYQEHLY